MMIFWYILITHLLTCFTLARLFKQAGISPTKAYIPVLNFVEWSKLIGKPAWETIYLLVPIVNIFTYSRMKVNLVRSFGKYRFWHTTLAVIFNPLIFFMLRNEQYIEPIIIQEKAYNDAIEEAEQNGRNKEAEQLRQDNPYKKGMIREWVEQTTFAVFAVGAIRLFLIECFVIPTSSMEGSLLIGDEMFVSKLHYGLRLPMTLRQLPLIHNRISDLGIESYITQPQLTYFRLPAWESIQHNKLIVFNYPEGDSVMIQPYRTYSINDLNRMGVDLDNMPIVVRPIDKRDHYIKRCVGIAGDTLELINRQIYINGHLSKFPAKLQWRYKITGHANSERLIELGVNLQDGSNGIYHLTQTQAEIINTWGDGIKVEFETESLSRLRGDILYPHDTSYYKNWTLDNFGPIYIPKQGATIHLTEANWSLYHSVIGEHEKNQVVVKDGKYFINGKESTHYTFKQNYYWMMGDNRHNSEDSRYWGFLPENHIVGKPLFIYFSSKNLKIENGIRWNRIFKSTHE
jgi:signal peptidase I